MKLIFRVTFKIFLILTILAGCATTEEIKETDPIALLNQGEAFFEEGQYDRAIAYFNKAIKLNPRYAEVYNSRGFAYFYKKDYEKAWDDVHKAESLGFKVHPGFLKALRQASVRQTDIESTRVPVKQNRPREPSDPVIQSGVISILPGEKLFIEADLVDNKIVNLKHVKTNLNPARTFVLEFDQSGINVLKGSPGMFLSLKNPFGVPIKFNMEIVDFRGGLHQTSSCPVFPGIISKEMWPHSIPQLNISNPRVLAESGPFICY